MRRLLVVPMALILAACSPTAEAEPTPSPAALEPAASPSAEPSPTPEPEAAVQPDDMAACAAFSELLIPVQDLVTAIVEDGTGQTIDRAELRRVADELRATAPLVSSRMNTYYAPFSSVVLQLDDIFAGRASDSGTLDTGAYRDGVIALLGYCADEIGYRAP